MPKSYLELLKRNHNGKYVMPYHIGWNDRSWKDQASEFVFSSDVESLIYKLGIEIGRKCTDSWRNVDAIVAKYAGPCIARLIVDAANVLWVGIKEQEEKVAHLGVRERYHHIKSTATHSPEVLTDIISAFFFHLTKKDIAIYTALDLPSFHPPSDTELSDSAALITHIEEIGYYKFLFDRCAFLEGQMRLDKPHISIRSTASEKGKMYLRTNKLSELRDARARKSL